LGRAAVAAVLAMLCVVGAARAASDAASSGLPVPRFVSLKADRVTVRGGPDKDHDVAWIYTRVGWPVEITAEFENWRRIRDSDGTEGWVYHSLLSGKRMAAVQLKSKTDLAPLYAKPDAQSGLAAQLQSGVLGTIKLCTGTWCRIVGEGFDGWIEQNHLWGVYPDEKID
jgi:SH3-like domain-containing protein